MDCPQSQVLKCAHPFTSENFDSHVICVFAIDFRMNYLLFTSYQHHCFYIFFSFSSRRRHTRLQGGWSSDVCSSDLARRSRQQVIDLIASESRVEPSGCHIWTGALTNVGYGRLNWLCDEGHVVRGAHRIAYHVLVAPVPLDKVIDHLCRNRPCVNPEHMEPVRQRENVMRSPIAPGAINAAKTHCPQGHEY